jgi:acyl phosphate:glycerol-3-phosphate acyltransferase
MYQLLDRHAITDYDACMITFIIMFIAAYLLGSLSSAIITCKLMKLPDPRQSGSNNPGATNVLRIGGKEAAMITLIGDVFKGLIPVLIANYLDLSGYYLSAIMLAAFLGHLFPVFFKFKGGKGVATGIGGLMGLAWNVAGLAIATWLIIAVIFRYSSLAALVASIATPIYLYFFSDPRYVPLSIIMVLILIWRHRGNIKKLLNGTESKLRVKK